MIVLAREDAGAERIFQNNGVPLLINMMETGKPEMVLASIRTLAGMCTGHKARVRNPTLPTFQQGEPNTKQSNKLALNGRR